MTSICQAVIAQGDVNHAANLVLCPIKLGLVIVRDVKGRQALILTIKLDWTPDLFGSFSLDSNPRHEFILLENRVIRILKHVLVGSKRILNFAEPTIKDGCFFKLTLQDLRDDGIPQFIAVCDQHYTIMGLKC